MKRWAAWTAAGAMLVAAWGVAAITPPDDAASAPFPVAATLGSEATGRNMALTVTNPRMSEGATGRSAAQSRALWSAEGTWLVVDLEARSLDSDTGVHLNLVDLVVGERTFSASDRPVSMRRIGLATGLDQSGGLAYELPEDILDDAGAATARLRLGLSDDDRLDSVIELQLDLTTLPHESDAEIAEPDWSRP
ncbi:hypothetical protein [Microbacterium invictum]|uniref:hypothetical protein n=1 Tax=Microbacterium invictum TaxID=515415 RepID=UPI0018887A18|nr:MULTISPECIES: hypothetical protein [Microbacterium]